MAKPNLCKPVIEEELKKSSLNIKILKNKVKDYFKDTNQKVSDKRFYEALMDLLKDRKVAIAGYDFEVHDVADGRFQSFKEGVVFEWVKREQIEIFSLLTQLENPEPNNATEVKKSLRNIFEKKYEEYQKQEQDFYNSIVSRAESFSLKAEITELKEEVKKEKEEYVSKYKKSPGYSPKISSMIDALEYYTEIHGNHNNATMWHINDLTTAEACKMLGINRNVLKNYYFNDPINYPALVKGNVVRGYTTRETSEIMALKSSILSKDGFMTKDEFLMEKNIFKPPELSSEEIKNLFNRLLFYINTHDNYKFMKQSFSWALSDEKDSMEWFELFIKNAVTPSEKLCERLGIEKPKQEKTVYEEMGRDVFGRPLKKSSDAEQLVTLLKKVLTKQ